MEERKNTNLLPIIIGSCLIISSIIFAVAYYNKGTSNSLSVTGSASVDVVSDSAKFTGDFSRIAKVSALKYDIPVLRTKKSLQCS